MSNGGRNIFIKHTPMARQTKLLVRNMEIVKVFRICKAKRAGNIVYSVLVMDYSVVLDPQQYIECSSIQWQHLKQFNEPNINPNWETFHCRIPMIKLIWICLDASTWMSLCARLRVQPRHTLVSLIHVSSMWLALKRASQLEVVLYHQLLTL